MNPDEFVLSSLEINPTFYQEAFAFVDYGNVSKWFSSDRNPFRGRVLNSSQNVHVDITSLGSFIDLFCKKKFFYYGVVKTDKRSYHVQTLAGRSRFKTKSKDVHYVKHYITTDDHLSEQQLKLLPVDKIGTHIKIPKCNFDVELTMDVMRFLDEYKTLVLFSSDRDFIPLINFVRQKGKKVILFHSGPTAGELKKVANLSINAQRIREKIGFIK